MARYFSAPSFCRCFAKGCLPHVPDSGLVCLPIYPADKKLLESSAKADQYFSDTHLSIQNSLRTVLMKRRQQFCIPDTVE